MGASCSGRSDLYIVATGGSSPAFPLLSSPDISGAAGTWSPDGTRIAFIGRDETVPTDGTGIYVVDVGNSDPGRVASMLTGSPRRVPATRRIG